jgi:sporulation protein YlmC with PRC-barrel domain
VQKLKLSEIVLNHEMQAKIVGAPIVAPDGRQLGVVDDVYFNRDLTAKKVIVKGSDSLSFVVSANRLVLKDGVLVLQEPPQADILRAVRETCKALLELVEAYAEDDPQSGLPALTAAREHLKNALSALERS